MARLTVTEATEPSLSSAFRLRLIFAFFCIYILWGSTYLAIRLVVATVPPFFAAGIRFFVAGSMLYLWARCRGIPAPTRIEWRNVAVLGALMFLAAYAGLFWAEKTLPSGIAAVLVATIPVWTALFEITVFKKHRFHLRLGLAILIGLLGVLTLVLTPAIGRLNFWPCLVILGAELSWSFGTVLSKNISMPASKLMSAGGQMLTGGVMLLISSVLFGELHPFPTISFEAGAALLYLIVAGSIIAFTAYTWLLGRMPATKVASYAYVNPVIALVLGWWLGGEVLSARALLGAALVLASVVLLLRKN